MKRDYIVECYIEVEVNCPCLEDDDCECCMEAYVIQQAREDIKNGTYMKDYGEIIER